MWGSAMELSTPPPTPPRGACASNESGSSCSRPPQPEIDRADPLPPNCLLVPRTLGGAAAGRRRKREQALPSPARRTPPALRRTPSSLLPFPLVGDLTRAPIFARFLQLPRVLRKCAARARKRTSSTSRCPSRAPTPWGARPRAARTPSRPPGSPRRRRRARS